MSASIKEVPGGLPVHGHGHGHGDSSSSSSQIEASGLPSSSSSSSQSQAQAQAHLRYFVRALSPLTSVSLEHARGLASYLHAFPLSLVKIKRAASTPVDISVLHTLLEIEQSTTDRPAPAPRWTRPGSKYVFDTGALPLLNVILYKAFAQIARSSVGNTDSHVESFLEAYSAEGENKNHVQHIVVHEPLNVPVLLSAKALAAISAPLFAGKEVCMTLETALSALSASPPCIPAAQLKTALRASKLASAVDVQSAHAGPHESIVKEAFEEYTSIPMSWDALVALTRVELHDYGSAGVVFTAPHGIYLFRDNDVPHKPEDWTTFIAKTCAEWTSGYALVWSESERLKSELTRTACSSNRDPNYAIAGWDCPDDESGECTSVELPWYTHLRRVRADVDGAKHTTLHVDLHGRRDPNFDGSDPLGASDCDVGVGALESSHPALAKAITCRMPTAIANALSTATGDSVCVRAGGGGVLDESHAFVVNDAPKLSGDWQKRGRHGRWTVSRMGCQLGYTSVQLELSRRLRLFLKDDVQALRLFATALVESFQEALDETLCKVE